ncbi:MAG: hypothetical protein HY909_00670 [Deltaproteobacteria bacterium]|nr:hypothetical protein [Deltaproteobacteria bacterium]
MATATPLAQVKSLAGTKKDLVEQVKALATEPYWVSKMKREESWNRLSNTQLLRLRKVLTDVRTRFASRAELLDALATAEGHGKDADWKKGRAVWPLPRLLDALRAAEKRQRAAARKSAASKPA